MNWLLQLLTNRVIISTIAGTAIVQLIKTILDLFKNKRFAWDSLVKTGGMPSSHAGAIISMTTALYYIYGFGPYFIIAIVLSVFILRDAIGVRKTVGEIGTKLNELLEKTKGKSEKIYVNQGHTIMQVIVGSIIGWLVAFLICNSCGIFHLWCLV